jgi:hypothetical protein
MLKFRAANGQLGEDPLYDFENQELYSEVILNGETDFINVSKDAFGIGSASGAIGGANLDAALLVPLDISGMDRTTKPDIGAYQHIPEE